MDAWGHHVARGRAAGIEAVLRQSFADDVAVGHHADQPVVLSNRNGAYVMLTHQFRKFGDRRVWTEPVDALVHCVLNLHGRPPLLKVCVSAPVPSSSDSTTDRILSHGLKARRAHMLARGSFLDGNHLMARQMNPHSENARPASPAALALCFRGEPVALPEQALQE